MAIWSMSLDQTPAASLSRGDGLVSRRLFFGADACEYIHGYRCSIEIANALCTFVGPGRTVLFIADSNVATHAAPLIEVLGEYVDVVSLVADATETTKRLVVVEELMEAALAGGATRRSVAIVMGGGTVGNLGGMVAALLYRGLPLIHLPTTAIAAFDSVLSLKQAVNLRLGKNLCGTYHRPKQIMCDLAWLESMPRHALVIGLGEMAKNVLTVMPSSFDRFVEALHGFTEDGVTDSNHDALTTLLDVGIRAKAPYLAADPHERGPALVFEYGHTVGHALEFASGGAMSHGEAIGWGMLVAAEVAEATVAEEELVPIHRELILPLGLRASLLHAVEPDRVVELLHTDNKRGLLPVRNDEVAMVLLKRLGEPARSESLPVVPVPVDIVRTALTVVASKAGL